MKKLIAFLLLGSLLTSSCGIRGKRVRGNGNVKTDQRNVSGFQAVQSNGDFDVYVSTGPESVKIEGEDNLLPYIETSVEGGLLKITTKSGYWLKSERGVKVYVSAPQYSKIESNGAGDIIGQSKITGSSKLELEVNGSADIKAEVDAPEVSAHLRGSGDATLSGETKTFSGEILGSGNIKAFDLKSEETNVKIVGSGDADVFSSVKLDVSVAGSGDVRYKGGAQVNSHIAGSGGVKKLD
jgi:Putative auto-transporter adhesin, head GIN domain